jgi:prolyl oligopeptidase
MLRLIWSVIWTMSASLAMAAASESPVSQAPATDDDPFLWLEGVTDEHALDWVRERNAESKARLTQGDEFERMNARLLAIFNSNARIPYVEKIGRHYYDFWRDAQHERGVWRRTSWREYTKAEPQWETMLDLDALGISENENWVWKGATCLPHRYQRCLISLSRGGADATVVREFDLRALRFVEDGFRVAEAKTDIVWRDENTVFIGSDFGPGSLTDSGYPRVLKLWQRGTPLSEAKTVFEGQKTDVAVGGYRSHRRGFERELVYRYTSFFTAETYVHRDGKLTRIEVPDDAQVRPWREWLLIELKSDWQVGATTYPRGMLLATDFEAFLRGERTLHTLYQPKARSALTEYATTQTRLVLNELHNVRSRLVLLTPTRAGFKREALTGMPEFARLLVKPVDDLDSNDLFVTVTDFLTPTSLHVTKLGSGKLTQLKSTPAFFDATGLNVTQHEATSKDGTRVPYFVVARADLVRDGSHPTLLYGYGGFEVSELPAYSGSVGAVWLERGGVYVVANIRGGGEFGPAWHQAALKEHRHRAYEDFIAVAEDLIAQKITSTAHLGIRGGSNGGLLMGNMLTLRPDLFGAIVCQVPLLDMRRYNKLLAGASWMAEYGDPDDPEQWSYIRTFSPYHNLEADGDYPPILFTTSTRDDRVHPGHARKMVARMLDQGHDVLYYENTEGGHGGAANNTQAAYMWALAHQFLWQTLK